MPGFGGSGGGPGSVEGLGAGAGEEGMAAGGGFGCEIEEKSNQHERKGLPTGRWTRRTTDPPYFAWNCSTASRVSHLRSVDE